MRMATRINVERFGWRSRSHSWRQSWGNYVKRILGEHFLIETATDDYQMQITIHWTCSRSGGRNQYRSISWSGGIMR